jgi:hypothetical protein
MSNKIKKNKVFIGALILLLLATVSVVVVKKIKKNSEVAGSIITINSSFKVDKPIDIAYADRIAGSNTIRGIMITKNRALSVEAKNILSNILNPIKTKSIFAINNRRQPVNRPPDIPEFTAAAIAPDGLTAFVGARTLTNSNGAMGSNYKVVIKEIKYINNKWQFTDPDLQTGDIYIGGDTQQGGAIHNTFLVNDTVTSIKFSPDGNAAVAVVTSLQQKPRAVANNLEIPVEDDNYVIGITKGGNGVNWSSKKIDLHETTGRYVNDATWLSNHILAASIPFTLSGEKAPTDRGIIRFFNYSSGTKVFGTNMEVNGNNVTHIYRLPNDISKLKYQKSNGFLYVYSKLKNQIMQFPLEGETIKNGTRAPVFNINRIHAIDTPPDMQDYSGAFVKEIRGDNGHNLLTFMHDVKVPNTNKVETKVTTCIQPVQKTATGYTNNMQWVFYNADKWESTSGINSQKSVSILPFIEPTNLAEEFPYNIVATLYDENLVRVIKAK